MKVEGKHVAVGTVLVSAFCLGYWLFKKKKTVVEEVTPEKEVMEVKATIEIPLPTGAVYSEEEVTTVFKAAALYFGEHRFIAISRSMSVLIQSIEDTCKDKNGNVDENLVGEFMTPIIYMLDNKVIKKQHAVSIDVQAFTDEIIPRITTKRPGFERAYEEFSNLIRWEKPVPVSVPVRHSFSGAPPAEQPQGFLH